MTRLAHPRVVNHASWPAGFLSPFTDMKSQIAVHSSPAQPDGRPVLPLPLLSAAAIASLIGLMSCGPRGGLPDVQSEAYRETVRDFYSAAARIQTNQEQGAAERLLRAGALASGEPAIWYNLAVLSLRRSDLEAASSYLSRARETGIESSQVLLLSGVVERRMGNTLNAIEFMRAAVEADSTNVRALFALAGEARYLGEDLTGLNPAALLLSIWDARPGNTAVLLELMRSAAEAGDKAGYSQWLDSLRVYASLWPAATRANLGSLAAERFGDDTPSLVSSILQFGNRAVGIEAHRRSLAELEIDPLDPGLVMTEFIALPTPSGDPSPAETTLVFARVNLTPDRSAFEWLGSVFLSDEGPLVSAAANRTTIRLEPDIVLPFPGGAAGPFPDAPAAFFDYDYDFRMDLAVAGPGGLRVYRQEASGEFSDRTEAVGLTRSVAADPYAGVWALDFDLEGDMDLLLSTQAGPPRLLQNNGDGTFTVVPVFDAAKGIRQLTWTDLDDDGDPDAAMLDRTGAVHLFRNERSGDLRHELLTKDVRAIHAADFDGDGSFDLLTLDKSLTVRTRSWHSGTIHDRALLQIDQSRLPAAPQGRWTIRASDLDNNGALDLIVSIGNRSAIWLQDSDRQILELTAFDDLHVFEAADLYANGRLNLIATDSAGAALHLVNQSRVDYLSRSFLTRAADSLGDRRNNSFGIGGEIEIRSGLRYQRRSIASPLVHFGIGDRGLVDVARIIWPNGTSQALFDLESDQMLLTRESLKGSCPWVFAFDGEGMEFLTDFIWRSPLGLRINAVETAGIATTEDWIKIEGNELAQRDGEYDIRITAELWETHFFDLIKLRAIDHPDGTEIFINEAFVFPPDELAVHVTGELRAVAGAWDDTGLDVTYLVKNNDGRYLDTFGRYTHLGRALDHYVELDLQDIPDGLPVWLVAAGWIWPTDSSINVAIGQGDHPLPKGVRVDVQNDDGTWSTVHKDLGFPSGKSKTMLIDLSGIFDNRASRKVRLATNLEIYWDSFFWAEALGNTEVSAVEMRTTGADLRYRGFSKVMGLSRSLPETPLYDSLASTGPMWRDLVGFYTRFGDVRELLDAVDDRYVIMNAGDELALTFEALPPPAEGWVRDFVLVGDGWVKDGDYNTAYSKTVTPLPEHGTSDYTAPLIELADNPAYRANPEDWARYHTRYVSTDYYVKALRRSD